MNYPAYIKKEYNKYKSFANRGMDLEYLINQANNFYLETDKAVIYKKPTPICITKSNYNNGQVSGYFKEQSTLDYNGVYKGYYIDFNDDFKDKLRQFMNLLHTKKSIKILEILDRIAAAP